MAITAIDITKFSVTPVSLECGSNQRFKVTVKVTTTTNSQTANHFDLWIYDEDLGFDDALIFDPSVRINHGVRQVETETYKLKCDDCIVKGDQPTTGGRTNGSSGESDPKIYAYVKAPSGLTAQSTTKQIKCVTPSKDKGRKY